jgi:predicted transglutaminase-like cysteine proteinase
MGQALGKCVNRRADDRNGLQLCARFATVVPAALLTLALLAAPVAQAQTLASLPRNAEPLQQRGDALPTRAWTEFCERLPSECAVNTTELSIVTLTDDLWETLLLVNREVNTNIRPITDQQHWGVEDRWDLPNDGYGDCEDYQLLKRTMLIDRGLPRRALRMTVVIDDENAGHAVMMVRTDRGDLILDNKRDAVLLWNQTGYTYVKREGQDSMAWVSLEAVSSPAATANRRLRQASGTLSEKVKRLAAAGWQYKPRKEEGRQSRP